MHWKNSRSFLKTLDVINYKAAWDYQEELVKNNLYIKSEARNAVKTGETPMSPKELPTKNYLLFCEHPPVYTLGKSGHMENVLLSEDEMEEKEIEFFKTNRGGDITFHGLQQIVGYPILDLEKFYTDIGKYMRSLEEVIILTIGEYGIKGDRSKGETGVWIQPGFREGKEKFVRWEFVAAAGSPCMVLR